MQRTIFGLLATLTLAFTPFNAAANQPSQPIAAPTHHEAPTDHAPVQQAPAVRATTPAALIVRDDYVSVQVNVNENGENIVGDAANEPTLAVNPVFPNRMVICWRQFNTKTSNFRQAGNAYTEDGGQTWTFPGVIEPTIFRSDPVLDVDAGGNFFFNSLGDGFVCTVFKSTNGGATWGPGVYAYGGDKQWMIIDKSGGIGQGNIYAYWSVSSSVCAPGHFTRSTDGGETYEPCRAISGTPMWGTMAIGPEGQLYIVGRGFTVTRSNNAQNPAQTPSWDFSRFVDLDGDVSGFGGPNPDGLGGQAWIATDVSQGTSRGNVYVLASVERNSTADPLDVMFSRSTNDGWTWSSEVRVNDDSTSNGAYQWFGTMSVAPNGRIDVVWYDTRNDPGGYDSEVYYTYSSDTGQTWAPSQPLTPAFDPHLGWPAQQKLGDYIHMVSDLTGANLAYAATFNGEQDVYFIRIPAPCIDAGHVELDRPQYACDGTMVIRVYDCGPNASDTTIDTTTLTVVSDTQPGGQAVLLTETGVDTAIFEGTLTLSTGGGGGTLQVSSADALTARYTDANNGQGSQNVLLEATATVDCAPPTVSNVQSTVDEPGLATITLETDEEALGVVHYGLACDALDQTAVGFQYGVQNTVLIQGLESDRTYFYIADAEDHAGNVGTEGICRSFVSAHQPVYFTELFEAADNDLDDTRIVFTPNGGPDGYSACLTAITELPSDPAGGTALPAVDDFYTIANLSDEKTIPFYGTNYSRFYIGGNGYVTFSFGDTSAEESLALHFQRARISALFDDLDLSAGGSASWKQFADRAVVTFLDVPEKGLGGTNTFQIELYFDGTISISYLTIDATDGLVGLSRGNNPAYFLETDVSAIGPCFFLGDLNCDGLVNNGDIDAFILALNDPAAYAITYPACNIDAADCNQDGLINNGDIDSFVGLLAAP